ncbi:hypothetical protein BKA59DRAFT_455982 [Fusarium tricinctum]|uniref:BZIP domain-containing protein n=1 Tax=Fusarium tricinctum TaxID=61284 RepID=A0A8K0WAP4_9HYPO|nr:hypothetical protein BKA59DRAFT_455982 [Fusarium tricinctum]
MDSQQGHPRGDAESKERRREQNRIAQRRFREKSKSRLQSLSDNPQNPNVLIDSHSMALDQLETGLPSLWEHLPVVHDELFPSRDGSNEAILSSGFLKSPRDGAVESALTTLEYQRNELCCQADRLIDKLHSIYDIGHSIGIFPSVPNFQLELDSIAETFQSLRLGGSVLTDSTNGGQSD